MDIKDSYTTVILNQLGEPTDKDTIKKYRYQFWFNTRSKNFGLRLTDNALEQIKKANIRFYEIDIPKDIAISAQILVWLDQTLESPYHLTKKKITVLTESSALELYLFTGDIKKIGYAKSISKRFASNSPHQETLPNKYSV